MSTRPPRIVATAGLHGSASTWVFNVARELLSAAVGESALAAVYAEDAGEFPDEAATREYLLIKTHHGCAAFDAWLAASQARFVLSIRDPRDACISMSQRFGASLEQSARWLAADCNRMLALAAAGHPLLRYEDRFFERAESVQWVANVLDLTPLASLADAIQARHSSAATRSFARQLADLPPQRLIEVGPGHLVDRVTQVHGPHIGDTRSGKWRQLPEALRTDLTRRFDAFLQRFGYLA